MCPTHLSDVSVRSSLCTGACPWAISRYHGTMSSLSMSWTSLLCVALLCATCYCTRYLVPTQVLPPFGNTSPPLWCIQNLRLHLASSLRSSWVQGPTNEALSVAVLEANNILICSDHKHCYFLRDTSFFKEIFRADLFDMFLHFSFVLYLCVSQKKKNLVMWYTFNGYLLVTCTTTTYYYT